MLMTLRYRVLDNNDFVKLSIVGKYMLSDISI